MKDAFISQTVFLDKHWKSTPLRNVDIIWLLSIHLYAAKPCSARDGIQPRIVSPRNTRATLKSLVVVDLRNR